MEKADLIKQFAYRLRDTLISAGYSSQRSVSGVSIEKLAEITGYSPQICRKYLRGHALPDPAKLVDIAAHLKVSPGWLLFGNSPDAGNLSADKITLPKELLHYIFTQASILYSRERSYDEIADFLLDLSNDVSQINASEEQSKKIIDLALSSARHFSP